MEQSADLAAALLNDILFFEEAIRGSLPPIPRYNLFFALAACVRLVTVDLWAGLIELGDLAQEIEDERARVAQARQTYHNLAVTAYRYRSHYMQCVAGLTDEDCETGSGDDHSDRDWEEPEDDYDPGFVVSLDPNDIIGPKGHGEEGWVGPSPLPYTIRFENISSATAPAQRVLITQQLDADLDWRTFRVQAFGWGTVRFDTDGSLPYCLERIDLGDDSGLVVEVLAVVDTGSGRITWEFQTLDPETGMPPDDALAGFLPPNDEQGIGEGFVSYTVTPGSDRDDDGVIDARATIVFDDNEPIETPAIANPVDVWAPVTGIVSADGDPDTGEITVTWTGNDQGAGLTAYTVYVTVDDGTPEPWLEATALTSATYIGKAGHTYAFSSLGLDGTGNMETKPTYADTTVSLAGSPPEAGSDAYNTDEGQALIVTTDAGVLANDLDPEGRRLTAALVSDTAHGQLDLQTDGGFRYVPAQGFHGSDSFAYEALDGQDAPTQASVTITVRSVNDPPIAEDDTVDLLEDCGQVPVQVLDNDRDPDGDALTVTELTLPTHGAAWLDDDQQLRYRPDDDYYGPDLFEYRVDDGNGGTATARVRIRIQDVNDAPLAADDHVRIDQDSAANRLEVLANDRDPEREDLVISANTEPAHGTLMAEASCLLYTPDPGFYGEDSFIYTVADERGATAVAEVRVTVEGLLSLDIRPGWNLVSIPFDLEQAEVSQVLTNHGVAWPVWCWDGNAYRTATQLAVGKAYWIYLRGIEAEALALRGTRHGRPTIRLAAGWQTFGPAWPTAAEFGADTAFPLWEWSRTLQCYVAVTAGQQLQLGQGYWILMLQDGDLPINGR
jgi:VCBS repeat-containing protein